MNDHSKNSQTRYLREVAIVLAKEGFQSDEIHADRLCIQLDGSPLCEVTESGGVLTFPAAAFYRDVKKLKKGLTAALPYAILSIVPSAKALNRWGFSSAGSPVEAVNNPRTN